MKTLLGLFSLFLSVTISPTYAAELRTFELPSERLAPYLARPAPSPAEGSTQQRAERPRSSSQDLPSPRNAWRQEIHQNEQKVQELLEKLK